MLRSHDDHSFSLLFGWVTWRATVNSANRYTIKNLRKALWTVCLLHVRRTQRGLRLSIDPGQGPSGRAWRGIITPLRRVVRPKILGECVGLDTVFARF